LLLLLFIIYIVHVPVVRPRSCRVIYYFDTPALGIRHQLFDRVSIRMDDRDKWLISFGCWHPKWMVGVSEQLTSANDALRG
jgi:hypothetical protein